MLNIDITLGVYVDCYNILEIINKTVILRYKYEKWSVVIWRHRTGAPKSKTISEEHERNLQNIFSTLKNNKMASLKC